MAEGRPRARRVRRGWWPCLLVCALLTGCGTQDEADSARERLDGATAEVRRQFDEARKRFGERVERGLDELRQVIPQAERTAPAVRLQGPAEPPGIAEFMSGVLANIDRYWKQTFREAGLPEPQVRAVFVPPGQSVATACGVPADDRAALYCPADDTIYIAQQFASQLYEGTLEGLSGQDAGFGRAAGDFAVAYVLAHEYAHNLQQELGIFANAVTPQARPFELHADCWSGTWANSAYEQGLLEAGDIEEALDTALAIGDFDRGNAQHHGTPQERRDAVLTGYRAGEPSACSSKLPAT